MHKRGLSHKERFVRWPLLFLSGVHWRVDAESLSACQLGELPSAIRRRLVLEIIDPSGELQVEELTAVSDVRGLALSKVKPPALPAVLEGLAAGIASAGPQAVRSVFLRNCSGLRAATALAGVTHVDLQGSKQLTDVTALARAECINLSYCEALTDVSALCNSRVLTLDDCHMISDVSALGCLEALSLDNCCKVTDVSMLGGLRYLALTNCLGVTNVSALGTVRYLDLSISNLTDVSALGGVRELRLRFCHNVEDVSALGGVRVLDLQGCNPRGINRLGRVHALNVSTYRPGLLLRDIPERREAVDLQALSGVRYLNLHGLAVLRAEGWAQL